ncbi:beta-glucosidase [Microbacterium sp. SSM24]|uniref:beta-glucosidase n=1 Tax=Microbacterium sp. SSM24 TaxID=2991714 RepID=UPI002227D408|nr:glycoside hydrolase family 3 N-terminal domain-containing protein [Microbacterium sp. SSM24]MCW3493257.1 glycoside hydrolase family 3 C-terminal domain-containing protein [Microbacterium sp. SSM24]
MELETSQVDNDVAGLMARLSLEEKVAQLVGLWAGARRGDNAAPMQDQLVSDALHVDEVAARGLGQFTRHWGTTPLPVAEGLAELARRQRALTDRTGIGAVVHEECLTGVLAWGATTYPTPLAWGATFEPAYAERLGRRIGADLRALGVHQGLGPVLDVVRDARWGRVEECIAEDPLLVGLVGASYVRGLEAEGRVATLKHFAGYSGSRAGRNHAPVSVGPRELADVYLPPFERAVRAGARSVMNSYADVDGVPAAASVSLLTEVLRDEWGFEGTVVADYFAIAFLEKTHGIAASAGEAAVLALAAGIDVELPTGSAYLEPLVEAVRDGRVDEALVDRALERVLRQKAELGLLGDAGESDGDATVDLDSKGNRALAREIATASVVLLQNDGILPLSAERMPRLAVVGPNADRFDAMFGCYSYVKHVLPHHAGTAPLIQAPTVAEALGAVWPGSVRTAPGCPVTGEDRSGFADAVAAAAEADAAVVVLGDDSGMFGRGTSGEGCDRADLSLPGVQAELLAAVLETDTPVVLVLITGRPYELGVEADRCAAVVQTFFPGQEGGPAIADVLVGAADPGGRLPVQLPRPGTPQPSGYLHARLGGPTDMSSADPTPRHPFGFGLAYTTFARGPLTVADADVPVDGFVELELSVRNTGDRDGTDVLQVYAGDPVAQVVRPVRQLVAFRRVRVAAGEDQRWSVRIPAAALAFTGVAGRRIVEPGRADFTFAADAADPGSTVAVEFTGRTTPVDRIADEPEWTRVG